jgi:hypothetical protein
MSKQAFMTQKDYIDAVLDIYVSLPDTPNRTRRDDRYLAVTWYRQGTTLFQVKAAMLMAMARRTFRETGQWPLEPIRSLRYFVPLIEEIQRSDIDESYLRYLQQKLRSVQEENTSADTVCIQ